MWCVCLFLVLCLGFCFESLRGLPKSASMFAIFGHLGPPRKQRSDTWITLLVFVCFVCSHGFQHTGLTHAMGGFKYVTRRCNTTFHTFGLTLGRKGDPCFVGIQL